MSLSQCAEHLVPVVTFRPIGTSFNFMESYLCLKICVPIVAPPLGANPIAVSTVAFRCGRKILPHQLVQITKSIGLANRLRCTAEHLHSRSEGGSDALCNIVAACAFCNHTRHRAKRPLGPNEYLRHVRTRMMKGQWHPERIHQFVVASTLEQHRHECGSKD